MGLSLATGEEDRPREDQSIIRGSCRHIESNPSLDIQDGQCPSLEAVFQSFF